MYDLTGFQRDLLYVIAGREEPHGLAIKEELEEYYEKEIHHGRLYPNLDTLVDKGLVEKGQRDRRTNFYSLTRRGRREIEARREWESQYVELWNSSAALAAHAPQHAPLTRRRSSPLERSRPGVTGQFVARRPDW